MDSRPTKKQKTGAKPDLGPRITDPRFANIQSDPRFRLPGKSHKVKLDKRFARVLKDDDFVKRATVDRYGRPLENNAERKRLKRKFELEEDIEKSGGESDEADEDDEVQRELSRIGGSSSTRDVLREGREADSESSSDESTTTDDEDVDAEASEGELDLGPAQAQNIPEGEVTSRIAIVNLDWDNIRASDLMAVFTSFLPSNGGSLLKAAIYPSEFGKERLEREELEGPPQEIFANAARTVDEEDVTEEEDDDEDIKNSLLKEGDDQDFNPTALRQYQLDRLRYFYAVLTFSSPAVAKHIYDAVDGTEYLRTANFFDLRFVPDDTDFSTDTSREECEELTEDYRPNEFVTDALQHSKVKLTWDAEDTGRKEAQARAFKPSKAKGRKGRQEMEDENDLRAYLASDNSDDEEDELQDIAVSTEAKEATPSLSKKDAERQRTRALLGLPPDSSKTKSGKSKDKAPVGDMQITFTSGLGGTDTKGDKKRSVFENSPEPNETTLEKYVRKERERKQKRKDKMKTGRDDDAADQDDEQQLVQEPDEAVTGFDDPFFADESSAAAIRSDSKSLRKEARLKKRAEREAEEAADRKQRAELELLMTDDLADRGDDGEGKIRHFDMREIEKAEKLARKAAKHKKNNKKAVVADAEGDDQFQVDTADPRFGRIFESHEYAIDPTNPRFKGTKGMKALLEEGRKRKDQNRNKVRKDETKPVEVKTVRDKYKAAVDGAGDVKSLVDKIKKRQKS